LTKKDRGFKLGTGAKIVRYPDRYMDERGIAMWGRVMKSMNSSRGWWHKLSRRRRKMLMVSYKNAYTSGILYSLLGLSMSLGYVRPATWASRHYWLDWRSGTLGD
jgi:hypothetical protein